MNTFDDRWHDLAGHAARRPAAPLPEPPRHLAAKVGRVRIRAAIPWPVALAAAALLYLALLPALPGVFTTTNSGGGGSASVLVWLPGMPHLPAAPHLMTQELR